MVATQFDVKISRTYIETDFQLYLEYHCITYQTDRVQTPVQNGVSERKNHHLHEAS